MQKHNNNMRNNNFPKPSNSGQDKIVQCSICKKVGHIPSSCFFRKRMTMENDESILCSIPCSICKKFGHDMESCYFRKRIPIHTRAKIEHAECLQNAFPSSNFECEDNNVLIFDGGHYTTACRTATFFHLTSCDDPSLNERMLQVDTQQVLSKIELQTGLSFKKILYYQGTRDGKPNAFHRKLPERMTVQIHEMKIQSGAIPNDSSTQGQIVVEKGVDVQIGTKMIECAHGINGEEKATNLVVITGDGDLESAFQSASRGCNVSVISMRGALSGRLVPFYKDLELDTVLRTCIVSSRVISYKDSSETKSA